MLHSSILLLLHPAAAPPTPPPPPPASCFGFYFIHCYYYFIIILICPPPPLLSTVSSGAGTCIDLAADMASRVWCGSVKATCEEGIDGGRGGGKALKHPDGGKKKRSHFGSYG